MASSSRERLDDENLTCQRCRQPLLLDPSISSISPSAYSLITSSLPTPSPSSSLSANIKLAQLPPSSRASAKIWAEVQETLNPLSDSTFRPLSPRQPFPRPLSTASSPAFASSLHALLSSRTPVDHPLCTECATMLQIELQKELQLLTREREAYISFEKGILRNQEELAVGRIRTRDRGDALDQDDTARTLDGWWELSQRKMELVSEEDRLRKVLAEKEKELDAVRKEEERVKLEEEQVEQEEKEFLLSHAGIQTSQTHLLAALHTAETHLLLSQSLLAHLESANVYNDVFQIGHVPLHPADKGSITVGTINGLRLGGRPVVDWDEINAGWGLVALCLDRIGMRVGCVFEGYRILPLGSFSRIEELPPNKGVYELYASSDLSPARLLQNRRFNTALVALLDLLRQLVDHGRRTNRGWGVGNVEIHKDRISNYSIRLPGLSAMQIPSMSLMGLGSSGPKVEADGRKDAEGTGEEQWTRACRAVLTVLKRVLVVESEAERVIVAANAPG